MMSGGTRVADPQGEATPVPPHQRGVSLWNTPPCSGPVGPVSNPSTVTWRSAVREAIETQGEFAPLQAVSGVWVGLWGQLHAGSHSGLDRGSGEIVPKRAEVRQETPWGCHGVRQPEGLVFQVVGNRAVIERAGLQPTLLVT